MREVNAEVTMMKPSSTDLRGLIVRKPFIDMILSGEKRVEIRRQPTRYRGPVVLVWRGLAYGIVELVDCSPVSPEEIGKGLSEKERSFLEKYTEGKKTLYVWKLANPVQFRRPVPVKVKRGAQTWVRLKEEDVQKILDAAKDSSGGEG